MFVQMFHAPTKDPKKVEQTLKRWVADLAPKAEGWLGSTGGVTPDGLFVGVARFETEAQARANSDRPEQGSWWEELSAGFDGEATFFESSEVDTFGRGGSDEAGFVQIITGRASDKERMRQIDKEMEAVMPETRPDVIGGYTAWNGDRYATVVYFTSEAEARANESKPPEGDGAAVMEEMQSLMTEARFFDLPKPQLFGA